MWLGTAGTVIAYRVAVPLFRSLRHRLRVVAVQPAGPGVVAVICRGHALDRLPLRGGQFLQWRFLRRGMWWQAHPYSVSAMPERDHIRVTVKDLGDHSAELARIRPGTWIGIEGPYGAFTADARRSDRVLLIGAGVGVTPLRALLEDLPPEVDATVILRAATADGFIHRQEFERLVAHPGRRLHLLAGRRDEVRIDRANLLTLVPDLALRDVYVCGPDGFSDAVERAARAAGVSRGRIHREAFAL
jgi:ferredoxin-NADP reductase